MRGLQSFKRRLRFDVEYESESLDYIVEQTYTPDFIVTLEDGRKIYLEAKGYFRAEDRRKLKLIREQHPDINLKIVFQNNNKLHKLSNTRYSDWCERHGFDYTIGEIPKKWFE